MSSSLSYNRQHYDHLGCDVPKGKKAEIAAFAQKNGWSVSELMRRAISSYIGQEIRLEAEHETVSLAEYFTQLTREDLDYVS